MLCTAAKTKTPCIDKAIENVTEQIVFLGHTHIQFKKQRGNILAVNPGSVGLARDGDKACYAVFENREKDAPSNSIQG